MQQRRRMIAAAAAALALLAAGPATPVTFAQSAGDEQYEDPFAGQDQGGSQDDSQQQAPAPAEPTPAPAAPATPPAPTAEQSSQQPELPRTGIDAAPILAIGIVLLGSGIALRVRLRERP